MYEYVAPVAFPAPDNGKLHCEESSRSGWRPPGQVQRKCSGNDKAWNTAATNAIKYLIDCS